VLVLAGVMEDVAGSATFKTIGGNVGQHGLVE